MQCFVSQFCLFREYMGPEIQLRMHSVLSRQELMYGSANEYRYSKTEKGQRLT
jgi:hypothetical protein